MYYYAMTLSLTRSHLHTVASSHTAMSVEPSLLRWVCRTGELHLLWLNIIGLQTISGKFMKTIKTKACTKWHNALYEYIVSFIKHSFHNKILISYSILIFLSGINTNWISVSTDVFSFYHYYKDVKTYTTETNSQYSPHTYKIPLY